MQLNIYIHAELVGINMQCYNEEFLHPVVLFF